MMMQERKIGIMGISETRRKTPGRTVLHDDYMYGEWRPDRENEVALIVTPDVANMVDDFKPINNRMAHTTVNFGREKAIVMIRYDPQQGILNEEKEEFFGIQQKLITLKTKKKLL